MRSNELEQRRRPPHTLAGPIARGSIAMCTLAVALSLLGVSVGACSGSSTSIASNGSNAPDAAMDAGSSEDGGAFDGAVTESGGPNPPDATAGDAGAHLAPAGIICSVPDEAVAPTSTLAASPCWTNPNVAGVSVGTHWNLIQPSAPTTSGSGIDWSHFDTALQLAKANHKLIGIGVAAGATTPSWVYAAGAPQIAVDEGDAAPTQTESEPANAIYQMYWKSVIQEMAARYDNEPNVAYVFMGGPGREFETYYLGDSTQIASFSAMSTATCTDPQNDQATGAICGWVKGSEQIVDMYASAFIHTPFLLVLANPFGDGTATQAQLTNGQSALEQLTNYTVNTYPGRAGIRSDGLRADYGTQYAGTETSLLTKTTTVGFQMNGAAKSMSGTLAEALQTGVTLGADFVEVFAQDCADPAQASALSTAGPELIANWKASH